MLKLLLLQTEADWTFSFKQKIDKISSKDKTYMLKSRLDRYNPNQILHQGEDPNIIVGANSISEQI